ncbi:hypothetical protein COCMIDRAFT_99744, partial [Bipolaris oryzae ATCC 44560]
EGVCPMFCFFHGSLASPSRLSRLFAIPSSQLLRLEPATLLDGEILAWAGRNRALANYPGERVNGCIYSVMSMGQEDGLRDGYEVVRECHDRGERDGSEDISIL